MAGTSGRPNVWIYPSLFKDLAQVVDIEWRVRADQASQSSGSSRPRPIAECECALPYQTSDFRLSAF